MRLRACVGCGRPVLELRGQFAFLDSFHIERNVPPAESAGAWHARCLADSGYGEAWCAARFRNLVAVRGYEEVAALPDWTVLRSRGKDHVALSRTGVTLSLSFSKLPPRRVSDGAIATVREEYNLELDQPAAIAEIQHALAGSGSFSIGAVFELLGIADRVVYPEALEGSRFVYDQELQREWGRDIVSAVAEYGVFVPAALEPFVTR